MKINIYKGSDLEGVRVAAQASAYVLQKLCDAVTPGMSTLDMVRLAAEFIKENTDQNSVFLTGQQHCNAVAALTGRYIVCGTGSYLYYHGVDYSQQSNAVYQMLSNPSENVHLFEEYCVDYIYISHWERSEYPIDEQWFAENTELVYASDAVNIYSNSAF